MDGLNKMKSFIFTSQELQSLHIQVPACLAGVKVGCVHLCRVAGNTV